ncbi:MAG: leucine-rich repeat domain-containing protein, partial [Eubacteriales bacterium]
RELYFDNNNLSDISLLSQTPMLTILTLSNNNIESDDIAVLADKVYLTYLSLNNNSISDISALSKLTALTELRLQCNNISDITALKNMTSMTKLYLGENKVINIDSLKNLTLIEVLYLNNNAGITDISPLIGMTAMKILNVSNCSINQIIDLRNMSNLMELYAENNEITGFSVLSKFTSMEKLLLAGNERSGQPLEWNEYLGGMANLKVLTLSGLDVCDLSFLVKTTTDSSTQTTITTVMPIERLEIANCSIKSTYDGKDGSVDNMEMIKKLELTLKYLDISSNPIDTNIDYLGFLSSLELLYADNISIGDAIVGVMANSQSMKYLSLENCNISDMYNISSKPWLSNSRKYVFVDLAQNPIAGFDFTFVENSATNLQYLYLDTTAEGAILTSNSELENNVLIYLSLAGFKMDSIELLPNMENLTVLNISNTKIFDLFGAENDGYYNESIARFEHVKYLDIGGNDGIFTQSNLNLLYDTFGDSDAIVYLYEDHSKIGFDAAREAEIIRSFVTDIPAMAEQDRAKIHSFYENPYTLQGEVQEYALAWDIDENGWFVVEDNVFAVSNWDMRENHTLTLTAPLDVYVNDDTVESMTFAVYVAPSPYTVIKYANTAKGENTDVVSTETRYFNVGWDNELTVVESEDYDFAGWYTALYGAGTKLEKGHVYHKVDANGNVPDLVCYAKWMYNVAYDLSGGNWTVTAPRTTYVSNEWISLPAETTLEKSGYTFGGWNIGEVAYGKTGTVETFGHTTLSAMWTSNPFNVIVFDGNEIRTKFASEYDATFDFIAMNSAKTG